MLKEMVKDVTTFFVFFLKIENLLNKYVKLEDNNYIQRAKGSVRVAVKASIALKLFNFSF